MKKINKIEFQKLIKDNPKGGIVFSEYDIGLVTSDIMVTDGEHGATNVLPVYGTISDWDWSINEYDEDDMFVIFDNNDILQMIQSLVSKLNIELE